MGGSWGRKNMKQDQGIEKVSCAIAIGVMFQESSKLLQDPLFHHVTKTSEHFQVHIVAVRAGDGIRK